MRWVLGHEVNGGWWQPMIPKRALEPGVEAYLITFQSLDCIIQVSTTSAVVMEMQILWSQPHYQIRISGVGPRNLF